MKKLIATFYYFGNFYELYFKNGKTSVIVIGNNKKKVNNDEICKKVIDEINELRNEFFYTVDFKGEKIDVFYDRIINIYYFKKDGLKIKEENTRYLELYKMYNYLPLYYKKKNKSSWDDDYDYDYERRKGYSSYSDDKYYEYDNKYKNELINNKKKKVKIAIGSIVLSVTLILGSFVSLPNIINAKDISDTESVSVEDTIIENTPVVVFSRYSEYSDLSIEEQIRATINENCGEQPEWVYEEAINDYYISRIREPLWDAINAGAPKEELDRIEQSIIAEINKEKEEVKIDFNLATTRTNKMIDAINSNKNISQEDKETIINGLFNTLQLDSKYYDEKNFEYVIFRLSNLTITRVETANGYCTRSDGFKAAGTCDYSGLDIILYGGDDSTLCHEVQHSLGLLFNNYSTGYKINEGMTETYSGNNQTYERERYFYILLEQIYGEDFFKDGYYNSKHMQDLFTDRFGKEKGAEHIDLYTNIDHFLLKYQLEDDLFVSNNGEYLNEINELLNELMSKYNEVQGLDWHDNNVFVTVCSILAGKEYDLPDNLKFAGIKKDLDGRFYVEIGGHASYYVVDEEGRFIDESIMLSGQEELIK